MKNSDAQMLRIAVAMLALASLYIFSAPRARAGDGPFNGKILFNTDRDGNKEIYTINANGSSPVNLSNNPANDDSPTWSPDGTKIAFSSTRDGDFEIFVMNADGTGQTQLTFAPGTDGGASWSPDGTKIAFHSVRDGNFEIFVMNADGTNQVRLTNNSATDLQPTWSPDGTKLAFSSDRDGNTEIYLMNADGTNQTRLTNNTVTDQICSFSPDGAKITFQRQVGSQGQVFVMSANGSGQTQLTSSGGNFSPSFSPDGTKITFSSTRDGNQEVYIMDSDGSDEVRLTNNPAADTNVVMQPVPKLDTIGVFRPSTGQFLLRNFNSAGSPNITISFGQAGDQPIAGDWNGDGRDDVGVFRPSTGQFRLRQPALFNGQPTNVITTLFINFGQAGDLAIVGDWNGDGIDTPGVFRPSTGQFLLTNGPNTSNTSPPVNISVFFGQNGDLPVAGDWNGDGLDSIGIYRESASCSFFLSDNNSTVNITATGFCGADPISPLTGDWNSNGIDTIGIHSSSLAAFSLSNSNASLGGPAEIQVAFGQAGDLPVAGDWNGGNTAPDSGVNSPSSGSSRAGQTQVFTTTCSDPDGWHNIQTIDFVIAKHKIRDDGSRDDRDHDDDDNDNDEDGRKVALWVQFDENRNVIRFFNPDLQTWTEGVPGANVVLSSRFADLYLNGTSIQGSGPTGSSVQITWKVVFKHAAVRHNYKQFLRITDDAGLSTGFDHVGSWSVTR